VNKKNLSRLLTAKNSSKKIMETFSIATMVHGESKTFEVAGRLRIYKNKKRN
jgi:hypothetical protein